MKNINLYLYFALFGMSGTLLANASAADALKEAVTSDSETLAAEASDAAKQAAEEFFGLSSAEREQHPWTIGTKFGQCLYKSGVLQTFPDCADMSTIQEWKDCCHGKTKADLSAAAAATAFKQTMSQGIFGMKPKKTK